MSIRTHLLMLRAKAVRHRDANNTKQAPVKAPAVTKAGAPIKKQANKALRNSPSAAETTRASEIAALMAEAGEMSAVAEMIDSDLSVSEVSADVDRRLEIRAAVKAAREVNPTIGASIADTWIADGLTVGQVKVELSNLLGASAKKAFPAGAYRWGDVIAAVQAERN